MLSPKNAINIRLSASNVSRMRSRLAAKRGWSVCVNYLKNREIANLCARHLGEVSDLARSIAFRPGGGMYLLDGFGGVHTRGDAVPRRTGYWPGWDIARDLVVAPDNAGYAVLDGFGGVHRSGSAPRPGTNWAWWGYDHAGGLAPDSVHSSGCVPTVCHPDRPCRGRPRNSWCRGAPGP